MCNIAEIVYTILLYIFSRDEGLAVGLPFEIVEELVDLLVFVFAVEL